MERTGEFYIEAEVTDVDVAERVREVNEDVWSYAASIQGGLQSSSQHKLFAGEGRFDDNRTLEIIDGENEGGELRPRQS